MGGCSEYFGGDGQVHLLNKGTQREVELLNLGTGCPHCTQRDKETYTLRKEMADLKAKKRSSPMLDQKDAYDIENRFTYHEPFGDQIVRYTLLRGLAKELASVMVGSCPPSQELSLALTKLEEATFWANASIARNEKPKPGDLDKADCTCGPTDGCQQCSTIEKATKKTTPVVETVPADDVDEETARLGAEAEALQAQLQ